MQALCRHYVQALCRHYAGTMQALCRRYAGMNGSAIITFK